MEAKSALCSTSCPSSSAPAAGSACLRLSCSLQRGHQQGQATPEVGKHCTRLCTDGGEAPALQTPMWPWVACSSWQCPCCLQGGSGGGAGQDDPGGDPSNLLLSVVLFVIVPLLSLLPQPASCRASLTTEARDCWGRRSPLRSTLTPTPPQPLHHVPPGAMGTPFFNTPQVMTPPPPCANA